MSEPGIEMWLAFVVAGLGLGAAAFYLAHKDDSIEWDADRRNDERRARDRRNGKERRSLARLLHDRLHNYNRRRAERREQERRRYGEWKSEVEQVRARVENAKQENSKR